jgi:hypothetical protein
VVQPFAVLRECGEVDGVGGSVPTKVGELGAVAESVVEWDLLGGEFYPCRSWLARDRARNCGNAVEVESVEVPRVGGDRRGFPGITCREIGDLEEA